MIRSDTSTAKTAQSATGEPLLTVKNLKKHFPITKGFFRREVGQVKAVDDVSFHVNQGETLGLVGESGCGKTTTGRCLLRAIEPTSGEVLLREADGRSVDIVKLGKKELHGYRQQMQMIFQDPYSSLNPRWTVFDIVTEPLKAFEPHTSKSERESQVADLLKKVGLRPEYMRRYPHAFSGGERQRIGIARALALRPRLVVADEAVSALDVSVRAQTLNLLESLQDDFGLTYLFISHDLSVVQHICDRIAVMYVGKIVELANTDDLFFTPKHPYTEVLLSSIPSPDPDAVSRRVNLRGEVADPGNPPSGCAFHPRCPYAVDVCATDVPELRPIGSDGHLVRCHRADELTLQGVD